jgi:hypothetical protein
MMVAMAAGPVARSAAQTNAPAGFQGFNPGDTVRVKVDKPPMDLARAYFQSQTASNLTVVSKGDRYILDKSAVTLSFAEQRPSREVVSTPTTVQPVAGVIAVPLGQERPSMGKAEVDLLTTMQTVQDSVLGNYRSDPGYGKASKYYEDTMPGVLSGQVSLDDLVTKAEETLKKVDEYKPEREKDPRFEEQISQLREFVARAHQGERMAKDSGKVE